MNNFNTRTHAIALAVAAGAAYAAHWFINHNAQILAVAQFIVDHPYQSFGYSFSTIALPIIAALYHNPSK